MISRDQRAVVDYFLTDEEHVKNCVILLGAAGTGKSVVINEIRRRVKPTIIEVLATTGIAAAAIGTMTRTIHSFARIGVQVPPESLADYFKKITNCRFLLKRAAYLRFVVVDEISMADALTLVKLDILMRTAKRRMKVCFGGCRVMLVGDLLQLPPVFPRDASQRPWGAMFWFEAFVIMKLRARVFHLTLVHRQHGETEFIKALDCARNGNVSSDSLTFLRKCEHTIFPDDKILPTSILLTNAIVNEENARFLREGIQPEEIVTFKAQWFLVKKCKKQQTYEVVDNVSSAVHAEVKLNYIDPNFSKFFGHVCMRTHAQVLFQHNIDTAAGITNGTRAVVVGWVEYNQNLGDYCLVPIEQDNYRFSPAGLQRPVPVVYVSLVSKHYVVHSVCKPVGAVHSAGKDVIMMLRVIPLTLAWAITAHRAQGLTLDRISVTITSNQKFPPSLMYVIISRCRDIRSIRVHGRLKASMFWVHPTVKNAIPWFIKSDASYDLDYPPLHISCRAIERQDFQACINKSIPGK